MPRIMKPRASAISRSVQTLIRTFRPKHVVIERATRTFSALGQETKTMEPVYAGEAYDIATGGSVSLYGAGQQETQQHTLLVNGKRDVQQGDFVTLEGRRFIVNDQPNRMETYLVIRLTQYEQ